MTLRRSLRSTSSHFAQTEGQRRKLRVDRLVLKGRLAMFPRLSFVAPQNHRLRHLHRQAHRYHP
jgi:hypothetical protein